MRLEALFEIPSEESFSLKLSMPVVLGTDFLATDESVLLGWSVSLESLVVAFLVFLGTKPEFAMRVL